MNDQQHTVYQYFAADGTLLYIGMTVDFTQRDEQHRYRAPWYPQAARHELEALPTRESARTRETVLIRERYPVHNRVHQPGKRPEGFLPDPAVRIAATTSQERAAINILTPQERKDALLLAARTKAASMIEGDDAQAEG